MSYMCLPPLRFIWEASLKRWFMLSSLQSSEAGITGPLQSSTFPFINVSLPQWFSLSLIFLSCPSFVLGLVSLLSWNVIIKLIFLIHLPTELSHCTSLLSHTHLPCPEADGVHNCRLNYLCPWKCTPCDSSWPVLVTVAEICRALWTQLKNAVMIKMIK